tara:strand:- start:2085 stop:2393 length:309 start_codon:yes stop_codon:yes gene_type:complete
MKDKPTLTLVSNNPNLKTYYVPLTTIKVEMYPVKASNEEEAIFRANEGHLDKIARRVILNESHTNDVYLHPDVPTSDLFARQIDHFTLDIKDYDYPLPSNNS